ncbi:uncharacterized protein PV06_08634 [Exophiala oligosperma]|uniref:Transcription factor domain-containing protein n=1 Tax=Exophiala oligosperma TaxID=215243 RepID=A0A0D2D8K3_9EURO|nr:uncharacterized protein PV06_08634 [Exophiala oligosperma]KIW38795.1 hypothetical protein PV06_08634 [Exophiala oligosperma]
MAATGVLAVRWAILSIFGTSGPSVLQAHTANGQASPHSSQPVTLAESLHSQVTNIIQSLDLSSVDIGARYFRGFHSSFPIIAPQRFHEIIREPVTPAADASVLLLSLALLTVEPFCDDLYMTAQLLFTSVQATTDASIALLQAAVVIAAYEYARGWVDAASISVVKCVRMGYCLGINKHDFEDGQMTSERVSTSQQSWNLWWCVAMLDSIIVSEADIDVQQPPAYHLTHDTPLPFDLRPGANSSRPSLGMLGAVKVRNADDFGRQAQSVFLLYRVRQAIYAKSELGELARIDLDIQRFLIQVMKESTEVQSQAIHSTCTVIAVRTLFILHQHILTMQISQETLPEPQMQVVTQTSQAALSTAAKMVIDAVADHSHGVALITQTLPFCSRKNILDAKTVASSLDDGRSQPRDLKYVDLVEKALNRRWGAV